MAQKIAGNGVQKEPESVSPDPTHWGPPLWARLHTGARLLQTPAERLALVAEITAELPPGCSCRNHWRTLLRDLPPAVDSAGEFWLWSVMAHNAVRQRKGQPVFPLAAAEALYPAPLQAPCS